MTRHAQQLAAAEARASALGAELEARQAEHEAQLVGLRQQLAVAHTAATEAGAVQQALANQVRQLRRGAGEWGEAGWLRVLVRAQGAARLACVQHVLHLALAAPQPQPQPWVCTT